jgi:hypothetical protein
MPKVKLNYYDARREERDKAELEKIEKSKTEFFRGRETDGLSRLRKYVGPETVHTKTVATLTNKAYDYYCQLRACEPDLKFDYMEQTRMLSSVSHLGYSAITSGRFTDASGKTTHWVFYFANFDCVFGQGETLFESIPTSYGLTYFALALMVGEDKHVLGVDTSVRGNGVIFSTKDPNVAMDNVIKLKERQRPDISARLQAMITPD